MSWVRNASGGSSVESSSGKIVGNAASWGAATSVSGVSKKVLAHSLSVSPDGSKALSVWYRPIGSKIVVQGATGVVGDVNQLWSAP